jgi:hypothetical protein
MSYSFRISSLVLIAATLACCGLLGGCGDGRLSASGTVTVDGQPLSMGAITFKPLPEQKLSSAGGTIREGCFELQAARGLFPGKYQVRVQAFRSTGRMVNDPEMGKVEEQVPLKFNESGTLEAEITAPGPNSFHFELTTKDRN